MVNDPRIVVLDEPTDGVDPVGRREIRDLLLELRDEGRTIFLNSHLLSELEMVCDRVAIMVQGQVAMQGTIDELTADSRRFEIDCTGVVPEWLDTIADTTGKMHDDSCCIHVATEDPESIQPILDRLRNEQRTITRVHAVRESLEDLFMRAVTEDDGTVASPGGVVERGRGAGGDA